MFENLYTKQEDYLEFFDYNEPKKIHYLKDYKIIVKTHSSKYENQKYFDILNAFSGEEDLKKIKLKSASWAKMDLVFKVPEKSASENFLDVN